MMSKKGLSDVVTTLIIILLALVAIGVVWVVVSNLIEGGSEDIGLEKFSVDVNFLSASINGNDITFTVKRASGQGNPSGLKFIVSDGLNSEDFTLAESLTELQEKTFVVTLVTLNAANVKTASVAPVYTSSGGEEIVGEATDTYNFGGSSGIENGLPQTGFCGDGIIQNPNGDAVAEQCDGANLGGNSCTTIAGGFGGGDLACTLGCQFDTSECSLEGGEGSECSVPGDCSPGYDCVNNICTCPDERTDAQVCSDEGAGCGMIQNSCGQGIDCNAVDGLGCDTGLQMCSNNLCVDYTATAVGTVYEVWPEGVAIYFDSVDLPNNEILSGQFVRVNLPRSTNCYLIIDYTLPQPPQTRVQVKVDGVITEIVDDDAVQIWPTYQSCLNSLNP